MKSKDKFTKWAHDQFNKYGVRKPETYTAEELKRLSPEIPHDFIDAHVKKRDQ